MLVTVTAHTFKNWKFGGTTAKLRIYLSDTSVASDERVLMKSRPAKRGWYKEVLCTVVGANLNVPTFTIDSTTDSSKPRATYDFIFWDSRGNATEYALKRMKIDNLTPRTFAQIIAFSLTTSAPLDDTYYTAREMDALLAGLSLAPLAGRGTAGRVFLSDDPIDSGHPEALGTNSVLLDPATTSQYGLGKPDVAPSGDTVYIGRNSPQITKNPKVASVDYANFPAAIAAIGATPTLLYVQDSEALPGNVTVPATTQIVFKNGAILSPAAGKTLIVNNMSDPGNVQCFGGAGTVRLMPLAAEKQNICWRGGANQATDKTAAINATFANLASNAGGTLYAPAGTWLTSGDSEITSNTLVEGAGEDLTTFKLTGTNKAIFKHRGGVYFTTVKNCTLDGNNIAGGMGYLVQGAYPTDPFAAHMRFEHGKIINCAGSGFRIWDTASIQWQVANITFDKSWKFVNNSLAKRINSINNVGHSDAFYATGPGQKVALMETCGQWTFTGEFAGFPQTNGRGQVETQTIVAASGITTNGVATATVTAAGMAGGSSVVSVPLTVAEHTDAIKIARAIREALTNNPRVAAFFHIAYDHLLGTLADIQIIPITPAGHDATMNLAINTGTAIGITNNPTSTHTVGGLASTNNVQGFEFTGAHQVVTFDGAVEEGFTDFITVNGAPSLDSTLNFHGATLQSPIRLNAGNRVNTVGCSIFPKTFRDGNSPVLSLESSSVQLDNFLGGAFRRVTNPRAHNFVGIDTSGHSGVIFKENRPYEAMIRQEFAFHVVRNENGFFEPISKPLMAILSSFPSAKEFIMLQLGLSNSIGAFIVGYNILRTAAGRLKVTSNEGNPGLDLMGEITSTGKMGYAVGAGGTVTQITSKNTGVTLNKLTGVITTHTQEIKTLFRISFTLTNSQIAETDNIEVNHISGGTAGAYIVSANAIAAGSCQITMFNASVEDLTEVLLLRFSVKKGVSS